MKINKNYPQMLLKVTVTAIIIGLFIILIIINKDNKTPSDINTENMDMSYMLSDFEGHLALFRGTNERPYIVLDEKTCYLNDYDKQNVKKGIKVNTEQELHRLIEDMTG